MKPVIIIVIVLFILLIIGLFIFIYSNDDNIPVEETPTKINSIIVEAYDDWPDNFRKWDKNLSWDDFEIVYPVSEKSNIAAQISGMLVPWYAVNVTLSPECTIEFLNTNVTAVMFKDKSSRNEYFFTNASDRVVEKPSRPFYVYPEFALNHEQKHFDISEIGARNLAKSLKTFEGKSFSCNVSSGDINANDVRKRVDEIIQPHLENMGNQTNELNILYDEKTIKGTDYDEQLIWDAKIEKALKELE